jgi:hypothetical protein
MAAPAVVPDEAERAKPEQATHPKDGMATARG